MADSTAGRIIRIAQRANQRRLRVSAYRRQQLDLMIGRLLVQLTAMIPPRSTSLFALIGHRRLPFSGVLDPFVPASLAGRPQADIPCAPQPGECVSPGSRCMGTNEWGFPDQPRGFGGTPASGPAHLSSGPYTTPAWGATPRCAAILPCRGNHETCVCPQSAPLSPARQPGTKTSGKPPQFARRARPAWADVWGRLSRAFSWGRSLDT